MGTGDQTRAIYYRFNQYWTLEVKPTIPNQKRLVTERKGGIKINPALFSVSFIDVRRSLENKPS